MLSKKTIERIINMLTHTESLLVFQPLDGRMMITGHDMTQISNIMIESNHPSSFAVFKDQLDQLKLLKKGMTAKDEMAVSEFEEKFGSMMPPEGLRDTNAAMGEVVSGNLVADFHFDWKVLEKLVKAMKNKSTVIRLQTYDNNKAMVFTEEGDAGSIGLFVPQS